MKRLSLCPIPGSKRDKKYDVLCPGALPRMSEPFMGGAARSAMYSGVKSSLGEINSAMRQIALAPTTSKRRKAYIDSYNAAKQRFITGIPLELVFAFKGAKESQKAFKKAEPGLYEELTGRWSEMKSELFAAILSDGSEVSGFYSFMQRSCFGNVMRLNPTGTAFNVSWHGEKLFNAVLFDSIEWVGQYRSIGWNPRVYSGWQEAISLSNPRYTYLLLDPPYWVDGKTSKMTPCYPGHKTGTHGDHDETFNLAVLPLVEGLRRGFPLIHLCNYYSPRLESAVTDSAFNFGYSVSRYEIGQCRALGNSNGRRQHGNRVDNRERPIEVIYELRPAKQLTLF